MGRAAPILAVLALTSPAFAQQPVAVAEDRSVDLNGDGRPDVVRVDGAGAVGVIITGGAASAPWKPFRTTGLPLRTATLSVRRVERRPVIVAEATFGSTRAGDRGTREAMILTWADGTLQELARVDVGPQGRDGEWSSEVELSEAGLLHYATRPGTVRCDGKPAYLFAERFDFRRNSFRRVTLPVQLPAEAPRLTATRTAPPGTPDTAAAVAFRFDAASSHADAASAADLHAPRELEDDDPATAWRTAGTGRGQFVTARQRGDYPVRALRIIPGDATSAESFRRAPRIKELGVAVGPDQIYRVQFPRDPARDGGDHAAPYWIQLPNPVPARCVTVVIADSYRGRGGSVIAELSVLTELEWTPGGPAAALAQRVAAGDRSASTAEQELRRLKEPGAAALARAAETADPDSPVSARRLRRLRTALTWYPQAGVSLDAGAVVQLVAGLSARGATAAERANYQRALQVIGAAAVPSLARLLVAEDTSADARTGAAETLAGIPDSHAQTALLAGAGLGPGPLRRAVVLALAGRRDNELPLLLSEAEAARGEPAREADLWRAVGLLARRTTRADLRQRSAAAIAIRLPEAESYELRYRLIAAAAGLDSPDTVAALGPVFAARTDRDPQAIALRRIGAVGLAGNSNPGAVELLAVALGDTDPGVREAAAEAFAERPDAPSTDTALIGVLTGDSWPRVRRAAAGALGNRCRRPPAADALYAAADNDQDHVLRSMALTGLVTCNDPRVADRLLAIAGDQRAPADLREHAARLLGELGDRSRGPEVVGLLRTVRDQAWSSEAAQRVIQAVIATLVVLREPAAVDPLLELAQDGAFPSVQVAAARALGTLCPQPARSVLRNLTRATDRRVRAAAGHALKKCGWQ